MGLVVVIRIRSRSLRFIPSAMRHLYSDLQTDLGTKDIDAYLWESEGGGVSCGKREG